jgi:hypothetical protein
MLGSIIGAVIGSNANKKAASTQAAASERATALQTEALRESTRMQTEAGGLARQGLLDAGERARQAQIEAGDLTRQGLLEAGDRATQTQIQTGERARGEISAAANRGIEALRAGTARFVSTMQPLTEREAEFYNPNFRLGLTPNQALAREDLQRQGRATIAKSGLRGAGRAGAAAILNADQRFMAKAAEDNDQLNRTAELTNIQLRESARDKRNAATSDIARMYAQEGGGIASTEIQQGNLLANTELTQGNRVADTQLGQGNRIAETQFLQGNRIADTQLGQDNRIAGTYLDVARGVSADARAIGGAEGSNQLRMGDAYAGASRANADLWSGVAGQAGGMAAGYGIGSGKLPGWAMLLA